MGGGSLVSAQPSALPPLCLSPLYMGHALPGRHTAVGCSLTQHTLVVCCAAVWEVFTAQPAFRHLHYGEAQRCPSALPQMLFAWFEQQPYCIPQPTSMLLITWGILAGAPGLKSLPCSRHVALSVRNRSPPCNWVATPPCTYCLEHIGQYFRRVVVDTLPA